MFFSDIGKILYLLLLLYILSRIETSRKQIDKWIIIYINVSIVFNNDNIRISKIEIRLYIKYIYIYIIITYIYVMFWIIKMYRCVIKYLLNQIFLYIYFLFNKKEYKKC